MHAAMVPPTHGAADHTVAALLIKSQVTTARCPGLQEFGTDVR